MVCICPTCYLYTLEKVKCNEIYIFSTVHKCVYTQSKLSRDALICIGTEVVLSETVLGFNGTSIPKYL